MTHARTRRAAPHLLMVASGFAAMGYEIIWTQQSAAWLGHESAAVLAVVAAFFGGLALGGLALGPRVEATPRPVRWYVACELVVAAWGLVLLLGAGGVSRMMLRAIGAQPSPAWHWAVAFTGTCLVFLPATVAMGASLPAMERITARLADEGRSLAGLYASNTLGAVFGVLAAAFCLIPGVGLARSAAICAAVNVLCGAIARVVLPRDAPRIQAHARAARSEALEGGASSVAVAVGRDLRRRDEAREEIGGAEHAGVAARAPRGRARRALFALAATGFLGIGYEVVVVRVLGQVTEGTVYTFALLLAVYLAGSAAGAALYQRWLARGRGQRGLGDRLVAALACTCLGGAASLWGAAHIKAWAHDRLGASFTAALAAEAWLAVLAFALPTVAMGAVFSHLSRAASRAGLGFGRALGVNMLAAAAAPAVCGVIAVPLLGPKLVLLLVSVAYLAVATRRAWTRPAPWIVVTAALAIAVFAPALRFVDVPDGGHIVSYQEGAMGAVSVVEDAAGVARLRIDNRQQEGSSATGRVDGRQAWLALLLHPAPRRALFLGLGTGVTSSAAAEDPTLAVDVVELLPEVIAASAHFTDRLGGARPGLHLLAADARRYVRATDRSYDVIVADNFHPSRSGSAALYTVEHFAAVRDRLAPAGLFCQWLPVHQLDRDTLRSIVRSFVTVYPTSWAILASNSLETPVLGLIARRDDRRFDAAQLRARIARAGLPERLVSLGLEDEFAVLGSVVAGPSALARFAGDATVNTDDRPIVAYSAPRVTYAPDSLPRDRLIGLLRELSTAPDEVVTPDTDPAWQARLAAYWTARNRFIESGRDVRPSPRVAEMLAQVREPLLSVLRISPDFRPAYDPLLAMAVALARSDIAGARALLDELVRRQPARAEASRALASLGG